MNYNVGWGNLIPQKLKYTPAIAAKAAKLLQSGESLTTTSRTLRISRASLRNWRQRDPVLNRAFETFEANKAKAEAKRKRIKHSLRNRRFCASVMLFLVNPHAGIESPSQPDYAISSTF